MGDLDFDVRIKTAYGDPGSLMAAVGRSVAQGSFRVPVLLEPRRPFELVLVTRLGAIAVRGTAEVVSYEGNATWVRFLSASDQRGGDANLILWDVEVALAPGLAAPTPGSMLEPAEAPYQALPRLGTEPPRAGEGMPVSTAPPSTGGNGTVPPAVPTAARRAAVPARGSKPQPVTQKVVAVPPKARGTGSNTAIADRRANPILAPSGAESPPVPPTTAASKRAVASTAGSAPPTPAPTAVVVLGPPVAPPLIAAASTMPRAEDSGSANDASPSIDSPDSPAPAPPTPLRALSEAAFAAGEPPPMSLPSSVVPWWHSSGSPPSPRQERQERPALALRRMPTTGAAEHLLDVIADAEGETSLTSAARSAELAATGAAARTSPVAPAPVISPDLALAVLPLIDRAAAPASPSTVPSEHVIGSSTPFNGNPAHFDGPWLAPGPRSPQHPARAATQPPVRLDRRVLRAAIAIAAAGVAVAVGAIWWANGVRSRSAQQVISSRACGPEIPPEVPTEPVGAHTAAMISSSSAAVPAASAPAAVSAGDRCHLRIASNADPVGLWIDGKIRGTSPALVDIPCRPATVELRHPRYNDAVRRIAPEPGVTNVDIKLVRPVVTMKILSRPLGATVRVNGKEVGRTPVTASVNAFERGTIIWTHSGGATKTLQIYPQTDGAVVTATLPTLPPVIQGARPGTTR